MNEAEFAKLVQERPDLADRFHYVKAGGPAKKGFYRRIPITYRDRRARPASQLRVQLALGEASHNAYGKHGFSEDGTPIVAHEVRKAMKNKQYRKSKWEQAIEKLTESVKKLVEVVPKTET